MKKRVLSMLLAFILCFSTLPMTAFAQEADVATEQEADSAEEQKEQQEADSAEGQEEQQEADSAEEQEEQQEADSAEETSSDKSTTAGEAPDTVDPSAESVSDNDAGTQDTGADDEKKAAVQKVQALIDALPETVTEENAERVIEQLEAIDEAMAELTEEQREELNMTRLHAISEALNAPMTVAGGEHIHPVCGAICTDENGHSDVTWTATSTLNSDMDAGNYYLTADVTLDNTWRPKSGTALDLNGHSITVDADVDAITVPVSCSFTLTDCNSSDGVHYFTKNTGKDNLWEPVGTGGDTKVTGGVITHSSGKNGSGIFMGGNGTFTMYGGTICGNYNDTAAGAGVRATQSKIIMPGGAISGNVAANHKSGGGVNLNGVGSSFDMSGNAKITDNTTNGFGGGVHMECTGGKVSFTMSDNAQITGNMCTGSACGGAGLYASGGEFTMNDNAAISDNRSLSERGYGGGVLVSANATFTVNGKATISRNSAYIESTSSWKNNYGGGVLVLGGTFNMNGGSISDNMAENGAGVYVKDNSSNAGTFTMNGGTITNNKVIKGNGGGVYVLSGFEIANDAQVLNNSRQDTSGQVTPDNVYLTTGKTFQINGKLTGGVHSIGVSAVDTPAEGSPVTIATAATGYTLTEEDADCFTSDADGIYPVLANNKMQLSTTAPHRHYLCGKEHHDVGDHMTDSQMTFTKLWMDDDGKLKIGDKELTTTVTIDNGYFDQGQKVTCYELPAGNYYLGSSITLDYPIYIASNSILSGASVPTSNDVKLCLNGNTIKAKGDFSAIVCSSVLSKTTFTLTDCQQTAGTITHAADKTGSGVLLYSQWTVPNGNGTRFNMYGGRITGNTTGECGGGVNIIGTKGYGGIFNLYGGVISDNKANGAGGGVYLDGQNSAFTMYAGKITSNTAGKDGGGVSSANAKFIMNGGSITGNTAAMGGGVSVGCYSSTDFTMNGGEIKNNMASDNGGGVYMGGRLRSYTFTLNGTPNISGNTKADVANNVYLSSGAVITVGNLDTNVQIPVTLEKMPTEGFYVKFAKAGAVFELNDNIARQFSIENDGSDKCDKRIIENDPDELWLYVTGDKLHEHAICGESCGHKPNHSKVLWTPLTYDTNTQQLMYGSLPVPSAVKETSAADNQGNPTKAYYTTYKLPAGNYYLADTIDMKGGSTTYKGNEVTSKGGVLEIETDVNLCLNGKRLVTSAPHVGVIVIQKAGTLTLSDCGTDGEIRSSCNAFAGVQIANDTSQAGTFTMYDGAIKYTATGVLMGSNSIFNMYGGTIANNGTGVSVVSTSKLTVGGSADITGNDNENVFLNDKAMITIDSNLKNDARIGVTTEKRPIDKKPIQIATGATGAVLYTEIFKPDKADQGYVVTEDEQGKLYLNSHIHNWIYELSATRQTITAKCNVTGCPKPDGGWVTIDKPEHEVYGDGKSAEATLNVVNWQPDAVTVSNIKYEQPGKPLSEAPTDAGTYWALITIGNRTADVQYTINSKKVTGPTIEVADAGTYDGTEKKPSVVVKDGEKVIPDSEYSVSYADNSNAGIATVTITDVAGGNYDVSGSTTFTINKGAYNGTVEKKVTIIKKRSTAQTGTLTAADFFPEGAVPKGAVISNVNSGFNSDVMNQLTLDQDAGKISYITAANITSTTDQTCKVTISSANYQDIEATLIFHPTDKTTVTIEGLTYTNKTYDGGVIQPTGTLLVTGGNVPANELEVLYEGTGNTTYNGPTAPKDAGTYKAIYKVADSNETYTGSVEYAFTIFPKAVTTDMIGTIASQEYTGEVITPTPEVKDGSIKLTSGRDFDFSYDENTNAGKNTAILIITGKGNYTGTADKTFTIERKDIAGAVIELEQSELPYNGSTQTVKIQSVTVSGRTLTSGDYSIINGSDMFMSAKDSIPLMIEGKGNYTGTATTTWKIAKVDPRLDNFVVTPDFSTAQTYDGTPKAVTVQTKDAIGMGAVKVYYEGSYGTTYTRSETAPTNAGSYKVILAVAEGTNYRAKEIQAGILTIDKADLTVEDVTEFFEYTKTGAQTINIANLVPGARSYALGTAAGDLGVLSEAISIDATTGLMKFTLSALTKGNVDNKVTVPVTITSENYEDVTVNVIIYISPEYRIIDGANSSWTQNTDGTVVIRGNGEFNRFHAVKVDGKVIDSANYKAEEGSTIITLKAEYLKTLATGSHTFAIVWDNGIAGTNFTVAANTSSNNSGNNSNNNDSNHGSDNSGNNDSGNTAGAAANTAAASAQELDKIPATGDPFGIWLTLFAISLTGLAGMLARRKKN